MKTAATEIAQGMAERALELEVVRLDAAILAREAVVLASPYADRYTLDEDVVHAELCHERSTLRVALEVC